jgi:hypothetical protein
MPVFMLSDKIEFPPPQLASEHGLLAVGGDLSQERLFSPTVWVFSPGIRMTSRSCGGRPIRVWCCIPGKSKFLKL